MDNAVVIYENHELEMRKAKPRFVIEKIVSKLGGGGFDGEGERYYVITVRAEGEPSHEISLEWRGKKSQHRDGVGIWFDHRCLNSTEKDC